LHKKEEAEKRCDESFPSFHKLEGDVPWLIVMEVHMKRTLGLVIVLVELCSGASSG